MLGAGDGTFAAPVDYPADYAPHGVVLVDLSEDGHLDMVVSYRLGIPSTRIAVYLGNGDGTFGVPISDVGAFGLSVDRHLGPAWRNAVYVMMFGGSEGGEAGG